MNVQDALARGWSVIPTNAKKKPILDSWKPFQAKRPTEVEISNWIRARPAAWAAITGGLSGFITLDFDGEPGKATLARFGLTPHRRTPSGGFHCDFKHPGWKVQTLNSKSKRELGGSGRAWTSGPMADTCVSPARRYRANT